MKRLVLAAVVVFATAAACGAQGSRSLTFVNETTLRLSVDVSDGDGSRLPLLTLDGGTRDSVDEVADQGGTWVFRFESVNGRVGSVTLTRDQLEQRQWTVRISPRLLR